MKALSIQQPWAWLIVNGLKEIENRIWYTKYRGKFYIHASKTFDIEGYELLKNKSLPTKNQFKLGGIIGIAEIIDCVIESDSPWFSGPYGFVIRNAQSIEFKPCRGRLKFFEPEF